MRSTNDKTTIQSSQRGARRGNLEVDIASRVALLYRRLLVPPLGNRHSLWWGRVLVLVEREVLVQTMHGRIQQGACHFEAAL